MIAIPHIQHVQVAAHEHHAQEQRDDCALFASMLKGWWQQLMQRDPSPAQIVCWFDKVAQLHNETCCSLLSHKAANSATRMQSQTDDAHDAAYACKHLLDELWWQVHW
jgi:hypothetical protein